MREIDSYIELKKHYIAVLDDVFLAFHAVKSLFTRDGNGAAGHQIFVGNGFGLDKAAFKVAMDNASGLGSGISGMDGPCAGFFFVHCEIADQAKAAIAGADDAR